MRITWKDGLTTLSMGGAIALERAYFHNYDWPLVSSMRWVIGGLAILSAITLVAGFAFDRLSNENWDVLGIFAAVAIATITTLGLIYTVTDYVVALMAAAVAVWLVSVIHHVIEYEAPHTLSHAQ
jgi:hypothetical protein